MSEVIEKYRELNKGTSITKLVNKYFELLVDIQELKKEGNFKKMLKYCQRSLQLIEPLIVDTKSQYGNFDIKSIPAIEIGATFWAIDDDSDMLLNVKEIVDYFPELNPWKEIVEEAFNKKDTTAEISKYIKNNKGFEQKNLKKVLTSHDGRMISSVCYYMELMGRLKREKKGNTYLLFLEVNVDLFKQFKKTSVENSSQNNSIETIKKPVKVDNRKITATPNYIPSDIFNLLWFADGPYKNYSAESSESSFKIDNIIFNISFTGSIEPSAIFYNGTIVFPSDTTNIPKLNYFPSYSNLAPDERWFYLNWLTDVDTEIDTGYVFIFYYGLERHLFFGKFEDAYKMILRLRKTHRNNSFLYYSSGALITSCLFHNRTDLFADFLNNENDIEYSAIYTMAKYGVGLNLSIDDLINLGRDVGFTNRRYIKNELGLFKQQLEKLLNQKYGKDELPLKDYPIINWPKKQALLLANYSLDQKQRSLEVPSLTGYKNFRQDIYNLLNEAHENVKDILKENRKSKKNLPVKK